MLKHFVWLILLSFLLGCGNKGPLYLPDQATPPAKPSAPQQDKGK